MLEGESIKEIIKGEKKKKSTNAKENYLSEDLPAGRQVSRKLKVKDKRSLAGDKNK